ncbi:MAG: ABC-type transport auxiliary lipoprotein family protein [Rudaea sp.]
MRFWQRCILCVLALTALGGCSLLVERQDALTVYAPMLAHDPARAIVAQTAPAWQLAVTAPQAGEALDSTHIVVQPTPGVMQYYKDARWQDTPPAMMQELLVQALHDLAGLNGVAPAAAGIRADYLLRSDLHAFQSEYRGAKTPTVRVALTYQLVRSADGKVVAARAFAVEEKCASAQMRDVFAAFQSAINQVLAQVVDWTAREADADVHRASRKD